MAVQGTFKRGSRPDGTPWITYHHESFGNVVKLSMPHDPEFEKIRVACWDWEEARKMHPPKGNAEPA